MSKTPSRNSLSSTVVASRTNAGLLLALLLALPSAVAQTQNCPETNVQKVIFLPQTDGGLDVQDSRNGLVLADDFPCTVPGPISDIHIWGSWLGDNHLPGSITNFWLGIYDDVPAVTNGTTVIPSHPGTNLLWQQDFLPTQFSEMVVSNGSEQFYNPTNFSFPGGDTQVYYYCFYPTNPFVQQGTINAPTNYWLAARAQLTNNGTLYGWKTTTTPYHDGAVWNRLGVGNVPLYTWQSMTNQQTGLPINLSFKVYTLATNEQTNCCPEVAGSKWIQWPDIFTPGIDINASQGFNLADDFGCTTPGPITDIRIWGSWLTDTVDPNATYVLSIYADVPVGPNNPLPYSHPGSNLWQQAYGPGQYGICLYTNITEAFYTPNTANPTMLAPLGGSSKLYYLCFTTFPGNTFVQTGTPNAPTNYWLSVYVQTTTGTQLAFGWKTSATNYNDRAVWGTGILPPPVGWTPMNDPRTQGPVNMAFKINTSNAPPPSACVETNGVKYVQWPDTNQTGIDVWNSSTLPGPGGVGDGPWLLADDFVCTNTGPITDIHLWGSWWYDFVATNKTTFWIGLFEDVPLSATNTAFSYPGRLVWNECFAPGSYTESLWSTGFENFLDPGPPVVVGNDSQIWYYCFNPTNPPTQVGSQANKKTYWLAVYAKLPATVQNQWFGWKTTTNVQNDVSVHLPFNPAACPNIPVGATLPGWAPTFAPSGPVLRPLDLAFKLTTSTNCTVNIGCPMNKTNPCGAVVLFDPPTVFDSCCPTPGLALVSNLVSSTPCSQLYQGIWTVTDCVGSVVGVCTQYVTLLDTNAPIFTGCVPSKPVQCGTFWTFDTPTAHYLCNGSNAVVGVVSTLTNIVNACTNTATRVWGATNECTGAFALCTEVVTITDTNPPSITCSTNIVVYTCDTNSVVVTWPTNLASATCGSVTVTSTPPSGTAFPPNSTNTVVLTARNACGVTNVCGFTVSVRRPVLDKIWIALISSNRVVLTWTNGILQSRTNLDHPFTDVPSATSPYTNSTVPLPADQFFRLRCTSP